jgi:hypothetical protein
VEACGMISTLILVSCLSVDTLCGIFSLGLIQSRTI